MYHPWCCPSIHLALLLHPRLHPFLHLGQHLGVPFQSQERRAFILARRLHELRTMALWPKQTLSQVMSPICSAHLTSSRSPGRAHTSNKSTTLASTERSPPMLKLTTSTAEKRLLHHHHTGDRSRTQSGTNLSLEWRKFVERCAVSFSKNGATRRLAEIRSRAERWMMTARQFCEQKKGAISYGSEWPTHRIEVVLQGHVVAERCLHTKSRKGRWGDLPSDTDLNPVKVRDSKVGAVDSLAASCSFNHVVGPERQDRG